MRTPLDTTKKVDPTSQHNRPQHTPQQTTYLYHTEFKYHTTTHPPPPGNPSFTGDGFCRSNTPPPPPPPYLLRDLASIWHLICVYIVVVSLALAVRFALLAVVCLVFNSLPIRFLTFSSGLPLLCPI